MIIKRIADPRAAVLYLRLSRIMSSVKRIIYLHIPGSRNLDHDILSVRYIPVLLLIRLCEEEPFSVSLNTHLIQILPSTASVCAEYRDVADILQCREQLRPAERDPDGFLRELLCTV